MERGVHGVSSRHATNHVAEESMCASEPVLTPPRLLVDNRALGIPYRPLPATQKFVPVS